MGLLTGGPSDSDIVIESSEFYNNTVPGYELHGNIGHNIYVGPVRSFTLRRSYVHHARIGHNVKSRARRNYILYNRLMDEAEGAASYIVDLPDGGLSYLIGNIVQQGPRAENWALVSYAAEGGREAARGLYVVNNTFVNDRGSGVFIVNRASAPALVYNNIFAGHGKVLQGPGELAGNLTDSEPRFVDGARYDFRLTAGSPAIDAGEEPGMAAGFALTPVEQYVHPLASAPRVARGPLDAGAFEFAPP